MAATWSYTITVTNLAEKVANVTGRRHGIDVRTFTLSDVSFVTTPERTMAVIRGEIATQMIALYSAQIADDAVVAILRTQEALLAAATNAKET